MHYEADDLSCIEPLHLLIVVNMDDANFLPCFPLFAIICVHNDNSWLGRNKRPL